jgi:hypothetical protein
LREQLRLREAMLLDLGALVYELHRQGKRAPELLQQKAAELTVVDEEVRRLQAALDGIAPAAEETAEVDAVADDEEPRADEDWDEPEEDEGELEEPEDEGELEEPEDEDEDATDAAFAEHEEPLR